MENDQILNWFDFSRFSDRKIMIVAASKKSCPDFVDGISWIVHELDLHPQDAVSIPE
jgi:hypothetical protein